MKILGIDTILHDVCAAVVEDGCHVLSSIEIHSLMKTDELYRLIDVHLKQIGPAINQALKKAKCSLKDIDLIAVNNFGSFYSNVLIGVAAAETIAGIINKPLLSVNHQEGHYFSNWLERDRANFEFPILALSSSGGHSSIIKILDQELRFKVLYRGAGMDDRSGNKPNFRGIGAVYGYAANALGFWGPVGGAEELSKRAQKGDKRRFNLLAEVENFDITTLDFSVMESSVSKLINKELKRSRKLSAKFVNDLAAGFEEAMGILISEGLMALAKKEKVREVHLVGGISANLALRRIINRKFSNTGINFRYPRKKNYCTDNAAMIASLGYYKYGLKSISKKDKISIDSNFKLESMAIKQFINKDA